MISPSTGAADVFTFHQIQQWRESHDLQRCAEHFDNYSVSWKSPNQMRLLKVSFVTWSRMIDRTFDLESVTSTDCASTNDWRCTCTSTQWKLRSRFSLKNDVLHSSHQLFSDVNSTSYDKTAWSLLRGGPTRMFIDGSKTVLRVPSLVQVSWSNSRLGQHTALSSEFTRIGARVRDVLVVVDSSHSTSVAWMQLTPGKNFL